MVQFCVVIFEILHSTYGKKDLILRLRSLSIRVCPDVLVSILRFFFQSQYFIICELKHYEDKT